MRPSSIVRVITRAKLAPRPEPADFGWETSSDYRIAVIAYEAVGFNGLDGKARYELKVNGTDDLPSIIGHLNANPILTPN
jgi:hypothetical protein